MKTHQNRLPDESLEIEHVEPLLKSTEKQPYEVRNLIMLGLTEPDPWTMSQLELFRNILTESDNPSESEEEDEEQDPS